MMNKKLKKRNQAMLVVLLSLSILFYFLSFVKLGGLTH